MKDIDYKLFESKNSNVKIDDILHDGEEIFWSAVPKRTAYIAQKFDIKFFIFVLIWVLIDVFAIVCLINSNIESQYIWIIVLFFAFHLLPLWWLIVSLVKTRNEIRTVKYYITNERILVLAGKRQFVRDEVELADITKIRLRVSRTDRFFKVADLYITGRSSSSAITDIVDAYLIRERLEDVVDRAKKLERFYKESRICEYCGSTVKKEFKKCPYCGATIKLEYDTRVKRKKNRQ